MASIIVVKGPNEGDHYPLGRRMLVIGRGENCPIQITDSQVSRKHLQIRHDADKDAYFALDMKSQNGVLVNGRKIDSETELQDGDTIEIGDSKLSFSVQDFPDRESAFDHYRKRGERSKATMENA